MLISIRTLRLLGAFGDRMALDALDDLGINGFPDKDTAIAGRMTRSAWCPWWALADNSLPSLHWDRLEMLN